MLRGPPCLRWLDHPLRTGGRSLWLAGELVLAACGFVLRVWLSRRDNPLQARTLWLQHASGRILRAFDVDARLEGRIPTGGLLVSNHLSYLDVLVLGALTPAVFAANLDVKRWPVFGWFAVLAGTVFVRRPQSTRAATA